ncbi:ABC-type multidrug transport system ATPase subunit [Nocardiopsis mwathae]|uniref:ABC-type multidrug transport system ATPase subunit n=1 Tax=Nocardiopsis mwathae TaxID=1472723 RepID=A0A7W9YM56_9ACTN|nr:ABC transporter ATP-binding protein [Nocardiopsis mwathae]MBB6174684.1 ABC-type multidrug transport system ATPase subunit [Nocardiopsis mwathae]
MAEPVLAVDGVVRRYGSRHVLGPIDLRLAAGAGVAVRGPNGAGKSTLVRIVAGRESPDEGKVLVCGRPPREVDLAFRRDVFVLDEAVFYPDLTVREHLELVAVGHGAGRGAAGLIDRALERCRLTGHTALTPGRLSKGLQQLTLIAGLLVRPPARLAILDEPERHLDADARATLATLVEEAREEGAAVLLATHSDELADQTCDSRVAIGDSAPAPHDGAGT